LEKHVHVDFFAIWMGYHDVIMSVRIIISVVNYNSEMYSTVAY